MSDENGPNQVYEVDLSSRDKAEDVLENTPQLFEIDMEGNFILVPDLLESITGFSREELDLLTLQSVAFVGDRGRVKDSLEEIKGGAPILIRELDFFSEEKGSHPVQIIMLPRAEYGEIKGAWGAVLDIGERTILENRIETMKEGQERSKELLSEFVSLLSRQIRQPLTSILLTLEMMRSEYYGNQTERSLEKISGMIRMGESLKEIMNEALEMSQKIGENFNFERKRVDLQKIVEEVIYSRKEEVEKKKLSITKSYPGQPLKVNVDRKAIHQVMDSLISKAIDSSPDDGQIIIELEKVDTSLRFSVSDSGVGISEEEAKRIFDRFHIESDVEKDDLSQGLNLYISKRMIEKHNGRIWCESFPGLGSSYFFLLPLNDGIGGGVGV